MSILKNHLKYAGGSLLYFKDRALYNLAHNVPLRLFVVFFIGIFLAYWTVDLLVNSRVAEIIEKYLGEPGFFASASDVSLFTGDLGNIPLVPQLIVVMIIGAAAAIFTDFAMAPIGHAANDQKRFIANASHELRTPLSIMKTTAEVLRMRGDKVTKEEMAEFVSGIIEEVNRMSSIIEFFLRFATLESRQHFQMSAVSVSQVVNKVTNIVGHSAEEKGIEIVFVDRATATVWGNFTALEEMFINFVKNAINHTPAGGKITVSVREKDGAVLAFVKDTGSGISHEDLPHIFEPFFKGTNGARRKGGIGLGLTIVREIAKMHRAKITAESQAGKGTVFFVHFPKY